ncbi:sensor domain-containing diguanylate cyclase [Sedimenticola sp.]
MDHFDQAHILLAGPAETANEFFNRAAQAIAVATKCRWGGVGFSKPDSSDLEVVAIWDDGKPGKPFAFNIAGSPCELVYRAAPDNVHIYYAEDLQDTFSSCELLKALGAESYRGQAFYGEDQRAVGHIFALDDKPQNDRPEIRFFFELLSQRISAEYRRFNQQDVLRRYSNMVAITRNFMSFVDKKYTYLAVSQGYVDTFGGSHENLIGKKVHDVHGEALFQSVLKPLLDSSFQGESINTRHWIYPPDKSPKYVDVWQTPYIEEDGTISGAVVSGHDITPQKKIEETLQKLSLAITHSPVLTVITDPNGVIEYVSPIVEKITGYRPEEVIGKTPRLFKSGRTDRAIYRELWHAIKSKQPWHGELENRRKNGEYYWESISISPVLNDHGELSAFVGISMDISERKQMEQQLKEMASTDPLTGIFNRRHFMQEVESQLAYSKRYGTPLAFMVIDIDHFKQLNDSGGHALGDEAILQFTAVTRETIRVVDIFGRMGGDEFAIAMPDTDTKAARVLAERLREKISHLTIANDLHSTRMTISIGLSAFTGNGQSDESVNTLMHQTDRALYKAKRAGRNQIGTV